VSLVQAQGATLDLRPKDRRYTHLPAHEVCMGLQIPRGVVGMPGRVCALIATLVSITLVCAACDGRRGSETERSSCLGSPLMHEARLDLVSLKGRLSLRSLIGSSVGMHDGRATSVSFASEGRYVVSGGWDGVIRVWNRHDGHEVQARCVGAGPGEEAICGLLVSADSKMVVGAVGDNLAHATRLSGWALADLHPLWSHELPLGVSPVLALDTLTGDLLAGIGSGEIARFEMLTGREVSRCQVLQTGIHAVVLVCGGEQLLVEDSAGRLYAVPRGGFAEDLPSGLAKLLCDEVCFVAAGGARQESVLVGHTSGYARALDWVAGEWRETGRISMPQDRVPECGAVCHSGVYCAIGYEDGGVTLQAFRGGGRLWDIEACSGGCQSMRFDAGDEVLAVAGYGPSVGLRSVADGRGLWSMPCFRTRITGAICGPGEQRCILADSSGLVGSGVPSMGFSVSRPFGEMPLLQLLPYGVAAAAILEDGRVVSFKGPGPDVLGDLRMLHRFDPEMMQFPVGAGSTLHEALIVGSRYSDELILVRAGDARRVLAPFMVAAVSLSGDAQHVAAASMGNEPDLAVWQVSQLSDYEDLTLPPGEVESIRLSRDGSKVLVIQAPARLSVIRVPSGELVRSLDSGHESVVDAVWTNATQFVTVGIERSARVWSAETLNISDVLRLSRTPSVASGCQDQLVIGFEDSTAAIYRLR